MNRQDLKKILKPLIKECIKEVIFEDGVLSSVISEIMVATGPQIKKTAQRPVEKSNVDMEKLKNQKSRELQEQRKKMLDAIGKDAYNGVNIFEGITPTKAPAASGASQGPLSGMDPSDPGVDISKLANTGIWKKLAGN